MAKPTIRVSQTPTISTGIYAAGDAVGGLLEFADAAREKGEGGWIDTVVIIDKDQEQAALDLILFDRTFTATADNAEFDPSDADLANCIGHVSIASGDYVNFKDNAVATVRNVGLRYKVHSGRSLFAQKKTEGTPTFTTTSDLTVILTMTRD